jgi:intracellular sulfur oxidation DsrE/DsrF family protein
MQTRSMTRLLPSLALMLLTAAALAEEQYSDAAALKGVSEGKGLFLVDITEPKKTAMYLNIIEGTHAGLSRQGIEPDLVVVYIGPTVRFLTTKPDDLLEMEHGETLADIQQSIKELAALGVRQEVCAIANRVFEIDNATMPPELTIVGDGFISLIGYQSQGYKLVPIY